MADVKRTLTIRLPGALHAESRSLARARSVSLNRLIQDALATLIHAEKQKTLHAAFEALGQAPAEMDVEFAFRAQCEATADGD